MKPKFHPFAAALALVSVSLSIDHTQAADRIWSNATGTWDTTTANWSGSVFADGDNAIFSSATGNSALTLGANVNPLNFRSNGAATPATTTINGAAGFTLSLGNGTAGTANVTAANGSGAYEQNLTYNLTGAGSAFAITAGSGTTATPVLWNVASGKTFSVKANTVGQTGDINGNTVNLTGAGTVIFDSGIILKSTGGTGTFNVNAGILNLVAGGGRASTYESSITVNVAPGANIRMTPNTGAGTLYSQVTNLNGGTLSTTGGAAVPVVGTVTLGAGTTNTFTLAPATTLSSIAGTGSANLTSGTLILPNASTLSGGTFTVSGGILQFGHGSALGTDPVFVNGGGGAVTVNAGLTVNTPLTLKRGASSRAILTLGDAATWSGDITVDNTNVTTGNFAAIQAGGTSAASPSVVSGGIGFSTLGTPGSTSQTLIFRTTDRYGKVTGPVSLSNGYVSLLDSSKWEFSNNSNTWGTLDISHNSAIVNVGAINTLPATGVVTSTGTTNGGTLQLNDQTATTAYSQTTAGLAGNVKVDLLPGTGAATLTLNTTTDQSSSGTISGEISLVKSGPAKQTLTGVNTYTGSTTINGGTLALGTTGVLPAGDLTISSATLDLRKGITSRTQNVNNLTLSNATLDFGLNTYTDEISAVSVTASGNNVLKLHGNIPIGSYSLINSESAFSGNFTLDTTDAASGFTTYSGAKFATSYILTVSGTETPLVAYWRGDVNSIWNSPVSAPNSNWATDGTGTTDTNQIPGATSDVFFSASAAANTNTTLGTDTSIFSLTFESGTATVGGSNTLSILGALATSGNGLDVLAGANATLSTGSLVSTTPSAVQAGGTLTVNSGGLGSGPLTMNGTLNLNMSMTVPSLDGLATGTISRTATGGGTLTISGATNSSYAGTIGDGAGTLALAKGGASTLTLAGTNNYTGGTTISSGTILADASNALGSGTVTFNGGRRLSLGNGASLPNAISIGANSGEQGAALLSASSAVTGTATLGGAINITASPAGGGHFNNLGTGNFEVKGAVTSTVPLVHRSGLVTYWGGGSYASMLVTGTVRLGADNGVATNAVMSLGNSGAATLDLAGRNQTLAGLVKFNTTNSATIGNSSTTTDSVLTLSGTATFDGVITDTLGSGTRKTGLAVTGGTLTLGGANTYTGNTTVGSGAGLILPDNARIKFGIGAASGVSNTLSGAGSVILNGDFEIDTSLVDASALTSGSWTLENSPTLPGAYGSSFQVTSDATAWTATGDKWTKTVGDNTYTFDETTGTLTLSSGGGFDSWAASKGLTGSDAAFDADPDNDGIDNGLEFVLGGEPNPANPGSNSASLLPVVSQNNGSLIFSFKRKDVSESGVSLEFQWSSGLPFPTPGNDVPIGAEDSTTDTIGVDVTEDSPDTETDTIVITVPATKATLGKLFGRLTAVRLP